MNFKSRLLSSLLFTLSLLTSNKVLAQTDNPLISLEERPGYSFYCYLLPNNESNSQKCKVIVEDEKLIVYLEQGEKLDSLDNKKNTTEIVIGIQDVLSFNSEWWLADVGSEQESVGMFSDIQIGYLLNNSQLDNHSNFLTISANKKDDKGFSNENIPKILEQIEPWLYYHPDITVIEQKLIPQFGEPDSAQISKNIDRLLETNECPRCDLRNVDLSGSDLEGANLEGANLEGANLEDSKLKRSYLVGANLSNSNLYQTNFEGSIMFAANLKNSDLADSNLQFTNLQYSNLSDSYLTGANLENKGLNITELQYADLTNADLSEADLRCTNLYSTNLKNANLTRANLKKCNPNIDLKKSELRSFLLNKEEINTTREDISETAGFILNIASILTGNDTGTEVSDQMGREKRFVKFIGRTNLSNTNLSQANLTEANLEQADLFNSNLNNTVLDSTNFKNTDLTNSNLIDSKISNLDLEEAFLCNAIMPDGSVSQQECFEEEQAINNDEDD